MSARETLSKTLNWAVAVVVCAAWATAPALADQVGTSLVNGRMVILDSDGTWRYADDVAGSEPQGCDRTENLEVCAIKLGWAKNQTSGDFDLMYTHSQKYYFAVIAEPYGSTHGVKYQTLQSAIISNAARAAATDARSVPVLATEMEVQGKPGLRSITYGPTLQGTPFIFYNAYQILPDKSVQLVFWGIGKEVTPEFTKLINETVANVTFN